MTIGERILKLRKISNLTQGQFGEKLSVSDKAVSKWETEGGIPDIVILNTIADYFSVSLDFLMNGNNITKGDSAATDLISRYDKQERIKGANLEAIHNCKRLLSENGIEIRDEYLPQLTGDKTTYIKYGVFDKNDIAKFSLDGLLSHGLSKAAVKHCGGEIDFTDAILSDDISVYEKAKENYT
ncbi:MAG: helix-turn-helix domain-containing protein, partial [Clostridiales bacterium]|nr:helix-turn-helix domain-containing protein [Clostridiales bacterium]